MRNSELIKKILHLLKTKHILIIIFLIILISLNISSSLFAESDWPMVAGNPERTSWCTEEIKGGLKVEWYRPIEPYYHPKQHVIAVDGKILLSTVAGLYAFNAEDGKELWVYPTGMPLGNSPTVVNGIAYVGCYDRTVHAVDIKTGKAVPGWKSAIAEAGFEANPVVVNGKVYLGNRDGYFYALDAKTGKLVWRVKCGGSIHISAAYKDGVFYFAANDSCGYAIKDAGNKGQLLWKSKKLPGDGFHTYWAVIYEDYVFLSSGYNYRDASGKFICTMERDELFPDHNKKEKKSKIIFPLGKDKWRWPEDTVTMDMTKAAEYLEAKPHRRGVIILRRDNGKELTFDFDKDGKSDYAPITASQVTHSGNRYPPIISPRGVPYLTTAYMNFPWICRGDIVGWKFGTPIASRIAGSHAVDEPMAYSGGGDVIYWSLTCAREAGSYDLTKPFNQDKKKNRGRSAHYYGYSLRKEAPKHDVGYSGNDNNGWGTFGTPNGVYGTHGVINPPIPYRGKLYQMENNCLIAWKPAKRHAKNTAQLLPMAQTPKIKKQSVPALPTKIIQSRLEEQVKKILAAGHLRPGFHSVGIHDYFCVRSKKDNVQGDFLCDYFQRPGDTILTLTRAIPFLTKDLQQQVKDYLKNEQKKYPVQEIAHIGWKDGASREAFIENPEITAWMQKKRKTNKFSLPTKHFQMWSFPQDAFYAAWKYAQTFGGAKEIFAKMKGKLEKPKENQYFIKYPYILNAYIAGYIGYIELAKLAGEKNTVEIQKELDRMMKLRADSFSKDAPWKVNAPNGWMPSLSNYNRNLNISRNFIYMTPELAAYLKKHAKNKVEEALQEYRTIAPFWFVNRFDVTAGEGVKHVLYDYHTLFQMKAEFEKASKKELSTYVDIPAFAIGDLHYINNLCAILEAKN